MKKIYLCMSLLAGMAQLPADAKIVHLLPRPHVINAVADAPAFALGRAVSIDDPTACKYLERVFVENGCTIEAGAAAKVKVELVTSIDGAFNHALESFPDEAYTLNISAAEVSIKALTPTGVIRAAQTLAQLAEGYEGTPALEALSMTDWPAFKLRGFMHDVGRSFISFEELKKEIDLLARFKVNTFHWHLTENQAWRFEVKAYPQLTSEASMTRFAGKFYTQEQCRELEAYAAERGVTVIPEIDMPGHSAAFKRAMGHGMQTDEGVAELQEILEEVAATFPLAPYLHIGADEEAITYPNFLKIMTDKVHALGKKVVVWNPIRGVSISKDAGFDMTQMWSTSGRKVEGLANIDCRYNYTNHFDVFADLVGIYKSNIYYQEQGDANVAGTISAPWNDRKTPTETDIIRQNNIYANILASAERAWIGGGKQYIEVGGTTLPNSGEEYEEFADWERRFLFHKANSLRNESIPYVKQTNVRWRITDAFPNNNDVSAVFPPETDNSELLPDAFDYEGTTYGTGTATGAGIYLRHTWGGTIPTYFSNPQTGTTAYAWTYVYSPVEQTAGALIEFQNYGRSENDAAPAAGQWDRKGSRIWLNGEEIIAPNWKNAGKGVGAEVDLQDENFTARKPTQVQLRQGWNKVFLKLPYANSGCRLNKWMFTFVLTDTEGDNALEGLVYSPNKCMDATAEAVATEISDIKKFCRGVIGEEPGYYPAELAAGLQGKIDEVEATLSQELSAEERAAQSEALKSAFDAFKKSLETAEINQPKASTSEKAYYYTLRSMRNSRYATSGGAGNDMTGAASATDAATWKFVRRTDGTFDIINYADGTYVSPNSGNDTALKTQTAVPAKGWTVSAAATTGFVIITSGNVQFNQTNKNNAPVYNWGDGSNKSDEGCQYAITSITPFVVEVPDALLTLTDISFDGTRPYRVPDELAEPVLTSASSTVALDFTLADNNSEMALAGSCDPTVAESFVCVGVPQANQVLVRYNNSGNRFTRTAAIGTNRHQLVVSMQPNNPCYVFYLDGQIINEGTISASAPTFGSIPNVKDLYLGGLVCSDNDNKYPMRGTIHSARFFPGVLSAEQVAAISYDNLVPTGLQAVESNKGFRIVDGRVISDVPFEIYSVDGRRIPASRRMSPGIYMIRTAGKTLKVIIR